MNETEKELWVYNKQKELTESDMLNSNSMDIVFNEYRLRQIDLKEVKWAIAYRVAKYLLEREA